MAEVPVEQPLELIQTVGTNCFLRQGVPGMHHTNRKEPSADLQIAPREENFV